MTSHRTAVINLFAGPGVGKSTTAADLFALMKKTGHSVEYVQEVAKDLTWEGNTYALKNQLAILSEQDRRLQRLQGKVRWVITDSPLLLGSVYVERYSRYDTAAFRNAVSWAFNSYRNINFLLGRSKAFDPEGRNQNLEEAQQIDKRIKNLMHLHQLDFKEFPVKDGVEHSIFHALPYHEDIP